MNTQAWLTELREAQNKIFNREGEIARQRAEALTELCKFLAHLDEAEEQIAREREQVMAEIRRLRGRTVRSGRGPRPRYPSDDRHDEQRRAARAAQRQQEEGTS